MRRTAIILVLFAFSVAGCGGRTYYKSPNATPAQEEKDYNDCAYEAAKSTGNLPNQSDREDRLQEIVEKCMKARGYSK